MSCNGNFTNIGPNGIKPSYNLLASEIFQAWRVNWRQQQPMPKPIASK
jgi:hypothetical protein